MLHVGNDWGRLDLQSMKLLDLPPEAHRQFRLHSQMRLQAFPDFVADCPAVPVVNFNGVAHDQTPFGRTMRDSQTPTSTTTLSLNEAETVTFGLCAGALCPTTAKATVSTTRQRSG